MYKCKYEGRKPSRKQIHAVVVQALKMGEKAIEITWGENCITLELDRGSWSGRGWIREIGGADLAQELNPPPDGTGA